MNDIQTIKKGQAELKDYYDNTVAKNALKKRRIKRMADYGLISQGDLENDEK